MGQPARRLPERPGQAAAPRLSHPQRGAVPPKERLTVPDPDVRGAFFMAGQFAC